MRDIQSQVVAAQDKVTDGDRRKEVGVTVAASKLARRRC